MTPPHKRALGALLALVLLHEVALRAFAPANVVPQLLSHGVEGAAFLGLLALAFMLLRLSVFLLVPTALLALLFDVAQLRIAYLRRRNRITEP